MIILIALLPILATSECLLNGYGTYNGSCIEGRFGIVHEECNSQGYLTELSDRSGSECNCYSFSLNPLNQCAPTSTVAQFKTQLVEIKHERKICNSYADDKNGYYEIVDPSTHRYGEVDPPIPKKCFGFVYGPPPGQLVEETTLALETFEECNRFGGFDPNEVGLVTGFKVCNGHGAWNETTRSCNCNSGWMLASIGLDYNNSEALSCVQCDYHYGPTTTFVHKEPPYCLYIESPDPINGEMSECGGRGNFINGKCSCFANSTVGYWDLGMIGGVFNLNNTEVFVESCILCKEGYHTYPFCV
jgi:hypothetical protein